MKNLPMAGGVGGIKSNQAPSEVHSKSMKTQYEKVFVAHVGRAIEKAKALGAKATWTTEKHLDALAEAIDVACGPTDGNDEAIAATRDCLGECYNISAYQQMLAKKFEKLGHFQREGRKSVAAQADDVFAELLKQG